MNKIAIITAIQAIRRQKKRTALTMLAISIGIASAITIMAAGKGIQKLILSQLDVFGPDTLYIETHVPHKIVSGPGSIGIIITSLKDRYIETVRRADNIEAAYGQVIGQETVSYSGQIKKIMLLGKGYSAPDIETINLIEGHWFTREEEESISSVAVLGWSVKNTLFGEDSAVNKIIYIKGKPFRVTGVRKKQGNTFFLDLDNIIAIPTKTMQKKLLGINYVQGISVKMKDVSKSTNTREELIELLRANHEITNPDPNQNDFIVNTTADAQASLITITDGITLLLVALVGISLIVGGVGIMNIMYVSVVERTFEIGLRKALGAKQHDILWQFLSEAIIITAGGGIAGVIFGALFSFLIYVVATEFGFVWIYSVTISSILFSVLFSAGIGVIFGYYPARQAARKNPIDALRFE